tara:strand:- start:547 stop:1668 length:1122 start_codon:yes stop_codon:yes gene_type:complete
MVKAAGSEAEAPTGHADLQLVQRTTVEQAIDGPLFRSFHKEILRATASSGRCLAIVRKLRPDVPRRGAVLLIHGFAQNRYTWHLSTRSLVNFFADAGLDVYNMELTGHGRSREFGSSSANSFEDYVLDASSVVGKVAEYSGHERIFLMGHSLGGAVCYAIAPRVTDQLAGVVTVAGMFGFGSNPITLWAGRLVTKLAGRSAFLNRLGASFWTRSIGEVVAARFETADALSASFPLAGWVPGSTEAHVAQERLLKGFDWTGVNIFLTIMQWATEGGMSKPGGFDYCADFARLKLPLLVTVGDRDRMLPPKDARPAYDRSQSPDKTLKIFSPVHEEVHWGHLDILLGRKAPLFTWPYLLDWILERCSDPHQAEQT